MKGEEKEQEEEKEDEEEEYEENEEHDEGEAQHITHTPAWELAAAGRLLPLGVLWGVLFERSWGALGASWA
eukprot:8103478-Pyramimonas_sp.AAC.1